MKAIYYSFARVLHIVCCLIGSYACAATESSFVIFE